MDLYILRHGIAEEAAPGQSDHARALTAEGVDKLKQQAAVFQRFGVTLDRVFTSPYPRARQTADLVAASFGASVEEDALLAPGCTLGGLEELFGRYDGLERVMIVGHQPDFGELVRRLTDGNVKMRKGTLAVVRTQRLRPGRGVLRGLYDPDVVAGLAGL